MRLSVLIRIVSAAAAAAALVLVPTSGARVGAPRSSCPDTPNISVESKTPSSIEFFNATQGPVGIHWLGFDGSRALYNTLQPRDSYLQQAFLTHAWLVLDSSGVCVGYVVSDQPSKRYYVMPGAQSATRTFVDPSGDGRNGPDVSTTDVLNDTTGQITFRIDIPNRADFGIDDDLTLELDTDQNTGTGDPKSHGAEYELLLLGAGHSISLSHWNGASLEPAPRTTLHVSYTTFGFNISISRSELGNAAGFNVHITTEAAPGDEAPDSGTWNYVLQSPLPVESQQPSETEEVASFSITSIKVRARPAVPAAGSSFRILVPSIGLKGQDATAPESVRCRASLGGRPFRAKRTGSCTFAIPKKAGGKKLVIRVTATYQGSTKTKIVRFTIRRRR